MKPPSFAYAIQPSTATRSPPSSPGPEKKTREVIVLNPMSTSFLGGRIYLIVAVYRDSQPTESERTPDLCHAGERVSPARFLGSVVERGRRGRKKTRPRNCPFRARSVVVFFALFFRLYPREILAVKKPVDPGHRRSDVPSVNAGSWVSAPSVESLL